MSISDYDFHRLLTTVAETQRTTNLIYQEIRTMIQNEDQLVSDVAAVDSDFNTFRAIVSGEVTNLQSQVTALKSANTDDPAVDAAIQSLQTTIGNITSATSAAQASAQAGTSPVANTSTAALPQALVPQPVSGSALVAAVEPAVIAPTPVTAPTPAIPKAS